MASIEQRGNTYRVVFRYGRRKFNRSLRTKDRKAADACLARLEDNLRRVELGVLDLPDGTDIASFLLSDGRVTRQPNLNPHIQTLGGLLDGYLDGIAPGSLEDTTLALIRIHVRQLKTVIGAKTHIENLALKQLQKYIDKRSRDKGVRGRLLSTTTIKKELATLSSAWTWGLDSGTLTRPLSRKGLRFPKMAEKPPFQTRDEIERKIARGGLSEAEQAELWDCLFLTLPEIEERLGLVKQAAKHPFIYLMFVFAAHTGARRSEMVRSQIDDFDFGSETVLVREKKRIRGKLSTRRVPLSPVLVETMQRWFTNHPGGRYTFCLDCEIPRSGKTREIGTPLTRHEAHDHFKRTLAGSKWDKLRGWHVFRHSFCSNCAAKGIDQRIINAWVGHQTEEMVRRYRHLIPNQQQEAIRAVFGPSPVP